jgi:hypothetical protein
MTYEQFIADVQAKQRQYIVSERIRYERLKELWHAYDAAAGQLGLHALDRNEIGDRFDELRVMEAKIDETHGDTPTMRMHYEQHVAGSLPPPPY